MSPLKIVRWLAVFGISGAALLAGLAHAEEGVIDVPALRIPESSLLSEQTRQALQARSGRDAGDEQTCPSLQSADRAAAPAIRKCETDRFYASQLYRDLRRRYPVNISSARLGGVYTETFTPAHGVPVGNRRRILINLHGGGFIGGARTNSHIESIPIAAVAHMKVISVDYRQAPESSFPAASEDAAAVYREVLKNYAPSHIGIYGCSAGGLLTAQTVAWLQKEFLPLPAAIGMFCEGAGYWTEGDSGYVGQALANEPVVWGAVHDNPYFKSVALEDPLAFPIRSRAILAKFPPALLIGAVRDPALSSIVHTHSVLVALGVHAQLNVWEGLGHAFFYDPALPQSAEVYAVVAQFFERELRKD